MSEFRLTIATDNAAFSDGAHGHELARILRVVAQRVEDAGEMPDGATGNVLDINGNRCGYWTADERDEEY